MLLILFFTLLLGCSQQDRLVVIGMDGLDPLVLQAMWDGGELKTFAKMRDAGLQADLEVNEFPIYSPPIWTSFASGYHRMYHGIRNWTDETQGVFRSSQVEVERIWTVADRNKKKSLVIGWLITTPVNEINGAMLGDEAVYQLALKKADQKTELWSRHFSPADLWGERTDWLPDVRWYKNHPLRDQFAGLDPERHPIRMDEVHLRAWEEMYPKLEPDLAMIYFKGADQLGHLVDPANRDRMLGDTTGANHDVLLTADGNWVLDYYRYLDTVLARMLKTIDMADTTVVLLSDHGFTLVGEAEHETRHRSPGVLYAWGKRVRSHGRVETLSQEDVGQTLFALAGLPLAEDMAGRVITEHFELPPQPAVETTHRLKFLAQPAPKKTGQDGEAAKARLDQLKALGYVEDSEQKQP